MRKPQSIKTALLLGVLLITGASTMTQANELTFKEKQELNQLKYGSDYLVSTTIPVAVIEKVKLEPDMAIFSVRLLTEADDAKSAFNDNAATMTAFRQFLTDLKIEDSDLKTLSYRNYDQWTSKTIPTKEKDRYRSSLIVSAKFDSKQFFDVVALLEQYHIDTSQLNSSKANIYKFTITELSQSADLAKSTVKERFSTILQKLNSMGIKQVDIGDYKNEIVKAPSKTEQVRKYFVDNLLQIKLRDFNQIGKVLMKVQELKMTFNNDIAYTLSDEYKDKIIQQHQAAMFKKLLTQAEVYLGNNQNGYSVGNLLSFDPNVNFNQPRIYEPQRIMEKSMMSKMSADMDVTKIIQAPAEYDVTLSMSGVFEVLKKRYSL